jgi:hypothetical protein
MLHVKYRAAAHAPMDPAAHTFSPNSPGELVKTLAQLLGGAVGCNIALNGKVTVGQECSGSVLQNGAPVPCCQADAAGAWKCANTPTLTPSGLAFDRPWLDRVGRRRLHAVLARVERFGERRVSV